MRKDKKLHYGWQILEDWNSSSKSTAGGKGGPDPKNPPTGKQYEEKPSWSEKHGLGREKTNR